MSTRTHGILDYIIGLALIAAPWLFGFASDGAETWIPVALGAAIILMAAMTNYELGMIKAIPMKAHLGVDVLAGLFLAVSPWLLDYDEVVWVPHLVVGLLILVSGVVTQRVPGGTTVDRTPGPRV